MPNQEGSVFPDGYVARRGRRPPLLQQAASPCSDSAASELRRRSPRQNRGRARLLVDHDTVSRRIWNRQILALHSTLGRKKAEVCERLLDINPGLLVSARLLYLPGNENRLLDGYDYIVDAIDTVSAKIAPGGGRTGTRDSDHQLYGHRQ